MPGTLQMLEESAASKEPHVLRYMDPSAGDVKVIWDPENQDETETARRTFDDCVKRGMVGYAVKKSGEKAEVMRKFDPEAKAVIMAAAVVGG